MKKMNKKGMTKGFTLTELVIVIVIIAILATVLIPSMTGYVKRAKKSNAQSEAASVYTIYTAWLADTEDNGGAEGVTDGQVATYTQSFAQYYADAQNVNITAATTTVNSIEFVTVTLTSFVMNSSNDFQVKCDISSGSPVYTVADEANTDLE